MRAQHVAWFDVWHFGAAKVPVHQAAFFAATERTQGRKCSDRAMLAPLGPLTTTERASRPAPKCLTVGCVARRTWALRQLHIQGLFWVREEEGRG